MDKKTILLVDDKVDFSKIISEKIRQWGYDVIESSSGEEAVEFARSRKPDLLILDCRMPGMDGIETLKKIRGFNKNIPALMFTAFPDENSIRNSEKLGICAYIPKLTPFTDPQDSLRVAIKMAEKKIKKRSMKRHALV